MPNVTVRYYRSDIFTGSRRHADGELRRRPPPVLTTDVTPTVTFAANRAKRQHEVPIGTLGGTLGKGDATFEFYADGRLKSVNSKGTGQAGDVLKALVKFAGAMGMVTTATPSAVDKATKACEELEKISGDGKPLTIVRRGSTAFDKTSDNGDIKFHPSMIVAGVDDIFGKLTGTYGRSPKCHTHCNVGKERREVAAGRTRCGSGHGESRWRQRTRHLDLQRARTSAPALVPTFPIQEAPWFGSHEVELQLHESGKVTKLHYTGSPDTAGMLGTLTDVRGAFDEPPAASTSDQAKAVQAEADLIYQQQRLALCQTNPSSCPK